MPAEIYRKIMKHGQSSAVVTIPMPYRRYNQLNPGDEVKIYYDSLLIIVPKNQDYILKKKMHLIDTILRM